MASDWRTPDDKRISRKIMIQSIASMVVIGGIMMALLLVMPFPYNVMVGLPFLIFYSVLIRVRQLRKLGLLPKPIAYYCMACGHKHKERRCPRCGSFMKRMG